MEISETFTFLLDSNLSLRWCPQGSTPLSVAVQNGKLKVCKLLLAAGADVNANHVGGTFFFFIFLFLLFLFYYFYFYFFFWNLVPFGLFPFLSLFSLQVIIFDSHCRPPHSSAPSWICGALCISLLCPVVARWWNVCSLPAPVLCFIMLVVKLMHKVFVLFPFFPLTRMRLVSILLRIPCGTTLSSDVF